MTDVFISYKKQDVARVRPIAEALAEAGYDVWWDHRIPPGRTYRDVIGAALETAKCVIVVWSKLSVEAQWVLDEADEGKQRGVLLPILIDDVGPPYGFRQIEAARLLDWNGDIEVTEWKHTLEAVAHLTGLQPGERPPVQISMPSATGDAGLQSPAMTLATPGAAFEVNKQVEATVTKSSGSGGGAGKWIAAAVVVLALLGGGYWAFVNNLFSGSLPPDGPQITDVDPDPVPGEMQADVFIHISAEAQRADAEAISRALTAAGHTVQGIENVGQNSPSGAEIRYFSEAGTAFAEAVDSSVSGAGLSGFSPRLVTIYDDIAAAHLEIYFPLVTPDTVSPPVAPPTVDPFAGINGYNVNRVTVRSNNGRFANIGNEQWAELDVNDQVLFQFREATRDDWSVYLDDMSRPVSLQLDLYRKKVGLSESGGAMRDIYDIVAASTQGVSVQFDDPMDGINGPNLGAVTLQNGQSVAYLQDGFWGQLHANGLPAHTFEETGRDEWSVYMRNVRTATDFSLDMYQRQFKEHSSNDQFTTIASITAASTASPGPLSLNGITELVFQDGVRLRLVQGGAQPVWAEVFPQTGELGSRWTRVHLDGHFMELTDDGRDARMRVDLIQSTVYLYFPDWGQFNPHWQIVDYSAG